MLRRKAISSSESSRLIKALLLISGGHDLEAEKVLMASGESKLSAAGLDLLARLVLRKGEIIRARQLWGLALQRDASYSPANRALAQFETPWVSYGLAKRILQLTGIAYVVFLCVIGLQVLLFGSEQSVVLDEGQDMENATTNLGSAECTVEEGASNGSSY